MYNIRLVGMCVSLSLVLLPLVAIAAEGTAGFPVGSVWISKTNATAGETLTIYTVLQNTDAEMFEGTVVFLIDSERIGTKKFELESGASELFSIEWKARAGAHTVGAAIEDASIPVAQAESSTLSITVAEPPAAPALAGAAATAAGALSSAAQAAGPVIASVANNTYEFIESVRLDTASRLESSMQNGAKSTNGQVAGTSTSNASGFTPKSDVPSGLSQMKYVAASAALVALKSRAIFYPLLLLALLFILYLLSRWASARP